MVATRSKPEPNQTVLEDFTGDSKSKATTDHQEKRRHDKVEKTQAQAEKRTKTEDTDEHKNDIKKESTMDESEDSKDDEIENEEHSESGAQKSLKPDSPRKKKREEQEKEDSEEKEPGTELKKSDDTDTHSEPIKINRAPVLTLFAACAAQFQYPDVPWPQCLSLGSAVSSMCAISKGRAIGQIPQGSSDNHADDEEKARHERYVSVLGFQVPVKDGAAYVGDTKKGPNEGYLKGKFGDRYAETKAVMMEAMKSWKGHEEEFEKKGFHMYEKFRPGSGGWGQVGGLHVEEITRTITRP